VPLFCSVRTLLLLLRLRNAGAAAHAAARIGAGARDKDARRRCERVCEWLVGGAAGGILAAQTERRNGGARQKVREVSVWLVGSRHKRSPSGPGDNTLIIRLRCVCCSFAGRCSLPRRCRRSGAPIEKGNENEKEKRKTDSADQRKTKAKKKATIE